MCSASLSWAAATPAEISDHSSCGCSTFHLAFSNPYTGELNSPEPNRIGGGEGNVAAFYSARGIRPGRVPAAQWKPHGLKLTWDYYDDTAWVSHDREYPPGIPQPMAEASFARARISELHDLDRTFVPAWFSSTYIAPWPFWMEMPNHPGHVIWHAEGLKLESIDGLPRAFRDRMEDQMPDRLYAPPYKA